MSQLAASGGTASGGGGGLSQQDRLSEEAKSFNRLNIKPTETKESRGVDIAAVEKTNPRLAMMWRELIGEEQSQIPLRLTVGNVAKQTTADNYKWTVYVKPSGTEDFLSVKSVTFDLHPTFSPKVVTVSSPPFQMTREGWGTFPIMVSITTTDGQTHRVKHNLSLGTTSATEAVHVIHIRCTNGGTGDGGSKSGARSATTGVVRMSGVDPQVMHGKFGDPTWTAPVQVTRCDEDARPGYQTMKAHEYNEDPQVLRAKVKVLAQMIRKSSNLCAYTGAGISTSSGIDDYASKSSNSVAMRRKKVNGFDAFPTLAHFTLTALYRAGHLKHWVQQNHDGLPQKSGYPQHMLNEIHGAWQDPSNPVVPMSGSLRGDLCEWMEEWEEKADLVLAMGSSLCGMNADRMVNTPTENLVKGHGLGAVIVSLQRTACDEGASLRFFAKIDDVMALLAYEMGLDVWSPTLYKPTIPKAAHVAGKKDTFYVPYDKNGKRVSSGRTVWNLQVGSKVRITQGPGLGYEGTIVGKRTDGHYRVRLPCQREGSVHQGKTPTIYILGTWWIEAATKGSVPMLPFVNVNRQIVT